MKGVDILPKDLMLRSLSDNEIVFNYKDSLKALDILLNANFAFLGWEGWASYSDGKMGHCEYQGTKSIDQKKDELWKHYSKRGYDFLKETIKSDYKDWKNSPHAKEYELYFCLTVVSEDAYKKLDSNN